MDGHIQDNFLKATQWEMYGKSRLWNLSNSWNSGLFMISYEFYLRIDYLGTPFEMLFRTMQGYKNKTLRNIEMGVKFCSFPSFHSKENFHPIASNFDTLTNFLSFDRSHDVFLSYMPGSGTCCLSFN